MSLYKLCNDFHMEKLNVKCCKFVLGLSKSTNAAVMGELGRLISVILNIIKYWKRLMSTENSLLKNALHISQEMHDNKCTSWISCVYGIFNYLDLSPNYILQKNVNLKKVVISRLTAKYKQCWETNLFNDVSNNSQKNKLRTFRFSLKINFA